MLESTHKRFDPRALHLASVGDALIYIYACFPFFVTIKQLPGSFEDKLISEFFFLKSKEKEGGAIFVSQQIPRCVGGFYSATVPVVVVTEQHEGVHTAATTSEMKIPASDQSVSV